MSIQQPWLGDPPPSVGQGPATSLAIRPGGRTLGPVQKQFNQLLEKIEAAKAALVDLQDLRTVYLPKQARRLGPIFSQLWPLHAQLVVFLDQRLQTPKGLSRTLQEDITAVLLGLAGHLIDREHSNPEIEEIYQRHSPDEQEFAAGEPTLADAPDRPPEAFARDFDESDSVDFSEDFFEATLRKAEAHQEAAERARAARQAKRRNAARQTQHAQETLDAHKAVREIYRKLASALHPDREPDPTEHQRKAGLMAQVNAANDRRDLLALLQLQLQVEQLNPKDVADMADEKLNRFNRVLKEQEKSLNDEKIQLEAEMRDGFGMGPNSALTARGIDLALRSQAQALQASMAMLRHDLASIQQDAELKRWVKQQMEWDGRFA